MVGKNNFNNKVVIVTGSAQGMGKAVSKKFGEYGAKIVINDVNINNLKLTKNEFVKSGFNVIALAGDVTKSSDVKNIVNQTIDHYGRVDILVNNAGINKPTDFEDVTDKDWDEILNTNLKGSFMISQEIFSIMKKQNYGRIINISSISGQYGGPRTVHYAVSKAGLITLGHCLARFGAPYNITCNNIAPGIISTEMSDNIMSSELGRKMIDNTLLKRPGTTDELTGIAVFLASEDSSYITGQTINVDGGVLFS